MCVMLLKETLLLLSASYPITDIGVYLRSTSISQIQETYSLSPPKIYKHKNKFKNNI